MGAISFFLNRAQESRRLKLQEKRLLMEQERHKLEQDLLQQRILENQISFHDTENQAIQTERELLRQQFLGEQLDQETYLQQDNELQSRYRSNIQSLQDLQLQDLTRRGAFPTSPRQVGAPRPTQEDLGVFPTGPPVSRQEGRQVLPMGPPIPTGRGAQGLPTTPPVAAQDTQEQATRRAFGIPSEKTDKGALAALGVTQAEIDAGGGIDEAGRVNRVVVDTEERAEDIRAKAKAMGLTVTVESQEARDLAEAKGELAAAKTVTEAQRAQKEAAQARRVGALATREEQITEESLRAMQPQETRRTLRQNAAAIRRQIEDLEAPIGLVTERADLSDMDEDDLKRVQQLVAQGTDLHDAIRTVAPDAISEVDADEEILASDALRVTVPDDLDREDAVKVGAVLHNILSFVAQDDPRAVEPLARGLSPALRAIEQLALEDTEGTDALFLKNPLDRTGRRRAVDPFSQEWTPLEAANLAEVHGILERLEPGAGVAEIEFPDADSIVQRFSQRVEELAREIPAIKARREFPLSREFRERAPATPAEDEVDASLADRADAIERLFFSLDIAGVKGLSDQAKEAIRTAIEDNPDFTKQYRDPGGKKLPPNSPELLRLVSEVARLIQ